MTPPHPHHTPPTPHPLTENTGWRWTSLVGVGLSARVAARARKISDRGWWQRNTAQIQRNQLRKLLDFASDTRFGQKAGFARLAALDDSQIVSAYRKALPVSDWYAFKDDLQAMRDDGVANLLWPGLVQDFAQTSGTTAGDKYIPVSRQMLRSNYLASMDIFANLMRMGISLPRMMQGRCLFLGGSSDVSTNEHGVRTGDLSGLVAPLIRWPIDRIYSPGHEIALESHWPTKIEKMARLALNQDIRMISGMPSWATVLMARVLELAQEKDGGIKSIDQIWPDLEVFIHGGVRYDPFDARFRQLLRGSPRGPDVPSRLELYPASEGFLAIQDTRGEPGLRLLTDLGNFYEFVPVEEIDSDNPAAFTCDEVDKGQRYVVVMSTCAGLWRYVLGDVVVFDTVPGDLAGKGGDGPARVRIVGRHRHFINAFGENLIVEHIEQAVSHAAHQTGLVVGEFTAAPVYPDAVTKAGLELVIELANATQECVENFAAVFDATLKRVNVDYNTKRTDSLGMGPATVTPVETGAFHRWLSAQGKLGGQHKCPRCANHRDVIQGVLGQELARV